MKDNGLGPHNQHVACVLSCVTCRGQALLDPDVLQSLPGWGEYIMLKGHPKMDAAISKSLELFYSDFLNANSWELRKDGVPYYLLDDLSADELKVAENELIKAAGIYDSWPILGLAHIKSTASLAKLYELLTQGRGEIRIHLAYAIYTICRDKSMIDIAVDETQSLAEQMPQSEYKLIDVMKLLPAFDDERMHHILADLCNADCYLIAYNAARALGRPTDDIVTKFLL